MAAERCWVTVTFWQDGNPTMSKTSEVLPYDDAIDLYNDIETIIEDTESHKEGVR